MNTLHARMTLPSASSLSGPGFRQFQGETEEEIRQQSAGIIRDLIQDLPRTRKICHLLCQDPEVLTHWECANEIAVRKLGMNDHGRVHAMVATASALQILEYLCLAGITPDSVSAGFADRDDAFLIVLTAALCHDIGNGVHRDDHISHSLLIGAPILDRLLPGIYTDLVKRIRIKTAILSAIFSHHGDPRPLTIEAGAVCIGDATDMTTGRARTAYDQGSISIHTISALSIDQVLIEQGDDLPVRITISMSHSAGLFQVQEILGPKIAAGPLTPYVEIRTRFTDEAQEEERRVVSGIRFVKGALTP